MKTFKLELAEQIGKVDKKITKKLDSEEFRSTTAQVESVASQLQHAIVLLNESLQLYQFKPDETK